MRKRDLDELKRASRELQALWARGAFEFSGDEQELEEIYRQLMLQDRSRR